MLFSSPTSIALPNLKDLPDCADFSKTVLPYLPQLYSLPQKVFERINDLDALQNLYLETNPLVTSLSFALFLTPLVLIVSEINKNYSQVDRLWSLIPAIHNCHYALYAHLSGLPTTRLDHVMAVSVLWGARLTFNYWRKGGYTVGSEDYRWAIVKEYVGPFWMVLFNIAFISLGQNILLWLVTTPTYILLLNSRITGNEITQYDSLFSKLIFVFVLVEFYADQQQWNFHQAKTQYKETAKVPKDHTYTREQLDRGFNTSGLWGWSRHPNFAAEQAVWVCLYQWCCCESWVFMNWTFAGAMSYLFLFQASTWLTEMLSASKYPEYAIYQQRVGKFLPKPVTKSMDAPKEKKEVKKQENMNATATATADKLRVTSRRG
ncbi:hypothetical protein BDV95DRAFT_615517 [Massariosphaeria phaeospora]|uniref:DUF1295-domain-containing protein n=1 Tax=Massariosphaeria phaeospora TaxID=100035 RepID=A0A7C8IEY3_9PLEO|nr:hypothetical protein BDV95DRAFT_615517 [Massariosphaeria phaeospora]